MPWHKTTFPLSTEINPDVVNIGELGWACYHRAKKPEGFGMFHATRGMHGNPTSLFIVYLTPVASELCPEIFHSYKFEPCEVPARDEQDIAFVLGDPRTMGLLEDTCLPNKYQFGEYPPTEEQAEQLAQAEKTQQTVL